MVRAAVMETRILRQPLNDHGQHERQAIGGTRKGFFRKYLDARKGGDAAYFRLLVGQYEALRDRVEDDENDQEPALQGG
jgi:hypothetical protein